MIEALQDAFRENCHCRNGPDQVFSNSPMSCLIADFFTKALDGKLPIPSLIYCAKTNDSIHCPLVLPRIQH